MHLVRTSWVQCDQTLLLVILLKTQATPRLWLFFVFHFWMDTIATAGQKYNLENTQKTPKRCLIKDTESILGRIHKDW